MRTFTSPRYFKILSQPFTPCLRSAHRTRSTTAATHHPFKCTPLSVAGPLHLRSPANIHPPGSSRSLSSILMRLHMPRLSSLRNGVEKLKNYDGAWYTLRLLRRSSSTPSPRSSAENNILILTNIMYIIFLSRKSTLANLHFHPVQPQTDPVPPDLHIQSV